MNWFEEQLAKLRTTTSLLPQAAIAVFFAVFGLLSVFNADVGTDYKEPGAFAVVTTLLVCAPVVFRRRYPLAAVTFSAAAIVAHILPDAPEGILPLVVMFLTYSVAMWDQTRRALVGLGVIYLTLAVLTIGDTSGLDTLGALGNGAFFTVAWAIGYALRSRRDTVDAHVREAAERAQVERQRAARMLAEERLRIAQELHDVVAHSMSVIAVQAGVGAHVLDERPDEARAALEAISTTSRSTLTEMRRLLGVLRDGDGARSHAPAPRLDDLPQLVDEVRAAGVPVTLTVEGSSGCPNSGVELSAYRVVQEALTNVIKHAGAPEHVTVTVRHRPGSLSIEVVDDGRGAAAHPGGNGLSNGNGAGHGLLGMRERVEVWGGELATGPVPGGGFRVAATIPYGADS